MLYSASAIINNLFIYGIAFKIENIGKILSSESDAVFQIVAVSK